MNAKVIELFKDEAFAKELGETKSAEEAVKLFESKGAEITAEELSDLTEKLSGDLSEDDLASVAGGAFDVDNLTIGELVNGSITIFKDLKRLFSK